MTTDDAELLIIADGMITNDTRCHQLLVPDV